MRHREITLGELAEMLGAELRGDPSCVVHSIAALPTAKPGQISFLHNPRYKKFLRTTRASAVIVAAGQEVSQGSCSCLLVKDPYFAYAKVAEIFSDQPDEKEHMASTAVIGRDCRIDPSARIGHHVVIGDHVDIGRDTRIGPGCVIGDNVKIGNGCRLWANVTVYYGVKIGDRCIVHSGAVLGSDGFGLAPHDGRWHKIPQLGSVTIGNDVEIGANTTVDRGALEDTVIGSGVKLDNQIQIAHNVRIGEHTAIAGCVGIAGSTKIGKHCMIGGASGIAGHITIADHVVITAMAMISKSITKPGVYSSGTGFMPNKLWQKNAVRFRNLDRLLRKWERIWSKIDGKS